MNRSSDLSYIIPLYVDSVANNQPRHFSPIASREHPSLSGIDLKTVPSDDLSDGISYDPLSRSGIPIDNWRRESATLNRKCDIVRIPCVSRTTFDRNPLQLRVHLRADHVRHNWRGRRADGQHSSVTANPR